MNMETLCRYLRTKLGNAPVPPEASVTMSVSSGQNDPLMPSASVSVSDTISVSVSAPHPDLLIIC
jgi:hypothetical protein